MADEPSDDDDGKNPHERFYLHWGDYQNIVVLVAAAWALSIAFSIAVFAYS